MNEALKQSIVQICQECGRDRTRLMDVVETIQGQFGCVSSEAMDLIAKELNIHRVEVESVVSFYSFLSTRPKGKVVIRVCNDVVDKMLGCEKVAAAFGEELGIKVGETTADGKMTLEYAPCIGMCDQGPAALINNTVFTMLSPQKAKDIVRELKKHYDPNEIHTRLGDGNNAHELVRSMVNNCIRKKGEVIFASRAADNGLRKAITMGPVDVINEIKQSKLRGRGGAGFPTGMKWEFTSGAKGEHKCVICNADEGEPGTFKDRVLLTETYDMVFEGMTIAGYAIGADTGIIYLRGEYAYLRVFLEKMLQIRRSNGLLGKNILGKNGFNFDIRIQMGAGAYICGEETALISSCEGLRGDPKTRPPFPAQKGYMAFPTVVNNVETFCCAARILEKGASWFTGIGTMGSSGTKLLSISGDCSHPGIYEYPFGVSVQEFLKDAGAQNTHVVLVGGPSGQFIGSDQFSRKICFDDLPTGGSIVVFSASRKILDVVREYMEFFVEESCGFCTPCRAGNLLLKDKLEQILAGRGEMSDLEYLTELGETVKVTSRCGLGQTSPNPILSTIKNFRSQYEAILRKVDDGMQASFDIKNALKDAVQTQGRESEIY